MKNKMKLTPYLFIFGLILSECNNTVKTYYPNGKIADQYSIDNNGKKNGIYTLYYMDGKLEKKAEVIHDSLSGFVEFYDSASGKLKYTVTFKKGLYNIALNDPDFTFKLNPYSFTEKYFYDLSGNVTGYNYLTQRNKKGNLAIIVRYLNDSISIIKGIGLLKYSEMNSDKTKELTVLNIPKCKRNFYVLDSADNTIDSCMGCKSINVRLDETRFYSLKTEYIDSTFHIKYSLKQPFINCDRNKYPDGTHSLHWERSDN